MSNNLKSTSLRDHLLTSVSTLPSPHSLHLTVLSSSPKRTFTLFPHAHHPPKCFEREYLITLSCDTSIPASQPSSSSSKSTVLVSALSAYLYTLPTSSPPTSILYISKVDSSGYSPLPIPFTRTIITSFISYHVQPGTRPTERVLVQLFARSQGQYLFANSSQGSGKRVVKGLGLCGWWKGVYEDVAREITLQEGVKLSYLLPSYSAGEAAGMLGPSKRPLPVNLRWKYSPPFAVPIVSSSSTTLATLIPSLPDDPKSRFLAELVADAEPDIQPSPKKSKGLNRKERGAAEDEDDRKRAEAALGRVSPGEFWERMGYRQECSSGDVTGFFTLAVGVGAPSPPGALISMKDGERVGEPKKQDTDLRPAIVERLLKALHNVDFGNRESALEGSALWLKSVAAIVRDEIGEMGLAGCTGEIAGKLDLAVQPKNGEKRKEEVVTVLQPRKKKK